MKKLFLILLSLSVLTGILFADKAPVTNKEFSPTYNPSGSSVPNREMWDILFTFEGTPAGQPGVATDGTNIYTAKWAGGDFYRFEMDGTQLETFQVAGASNVRDMCYDGTYFYGSDASTTIYVMDLANETLINTISVNCTGVAGVRHISYDPNLDGGNGGFWVGNWDEFGAIAMDGSEIHASMTNPESLYGSAYDPWTDGGPYIWAFSQNGSGAELHQFDIASLSFTGVVHDAFDIPGAAAGSIAGGLDTYVNDAGVFCMIAGIQQDPNLFGVYEIAVTADPQAPGVPTDVVLTPDAGGALEATIDWVCPDLNVNGDPLTELTEMEVYRGEDLIYTDSNPTIGGAGSYTDAVVPASGNYTYTVVGNNSFDEGLPVSVTSWVGEDVPNVVENLLLEDVGGDGYLTWDNPTTGLNGGAFNNPIVGYHITRSDGTPFELTGSATEFTDDSIPTPDYYSYDVQPYNITGDGGIATSNTVWIGDAFEGILIIDLDPTPTGATLQTSIENFYTGTVAVATSIDEYPLTSDIDAVFILLGIYSDNAQIEVGQEGPIVDYINAGGNCYIEGGDSWYYDPQYMGAFDFGPLFGISPLADGSSDLSNVDGADFLSGMTWSYSGENNYIDQLTPIAPAVTVFSNTAVGYDCGIAYDSGTYKTVGTSFEITGLGGTNTLDDAVEAIGNFFGIFGPMPDPGWIEGTVTLDGGTGNVEDVLVSADGETTNPAGDGTYSIELQPGTYTVTAELADYETATIADVVVEEGIATTGQDLTLTYIPPVLNPVENLMVDDMTGLVTWDAPGGGGDLIELVQHDGNAENAYYQAYDNGYGVVYDVSGYDNVTVEMCDFRHSSWGITGTWDYSIHIVDWDTYTELAEVTGLQTTGDDQWEEEIDLGSVSASGLVGLFMEPMGNDPADAYPCLDADNVGPDGMSYNGALPDYSAFTLSTVGDFLMDLWIMGDETDGLVKAKKFEANFGNDNARLATALPAADMLTLNQTSRDLTGYNVYLDETLLGNTTDLEYQLEGLINGEDYTVGVEAVYDEGVAETIEYTFTYNGVNTGNNLVARTELTGNYPNPFNPVTNIAYSIKEAGNVSIQIYNTKGQLVRTLVNEVQDVGSYTATWNGKDNNSNSVSSGIYFYKMKASGRYTSTKKMILMK